jgi:hypothetical protein
LERNAAERWDKGRMEGKKDRKKSKRKVNLTIFAICVLMGIYAA